MPADTRLTEKVATYENKFNAVKKQMMKHPKYSKLYNEKEIEVQVKQSLIMEAEDKIKFSLDGQIRRGAHKKKGLDEDTFSFQWKKAMKARLKQDGYPFELTKEEEEILEGITEKNKAKATKELTEVTADALKKILTSV